MKGETHIGEDFGRLTVVEDLGTLPRPFGRRRDRWVRCQCNYGQYTDVRYKNLQQGMTRSCGCFRRERTSALGR
jgi:hypothetical protein